MNKVILMGRLTANPELKHTQSNLPVVNFTLAVNRPYTKQGQERQADFIDIVCWRSTAEFVSRYFTKGQQVAVCGSLQVRNWQDQQGNKRRSYEVVADEVYFADSKRDNAAASGGYGGAYASASNAASAPAAEPAYASPSTDFEVITEDDGLPF
ncbi:MAG: single-stranded DNA-binding protein [Clostridia bacterium]|jgi:single-strand DNA-binding protein|nr:single-stranded DNA-binding protein [Clostridia bacterium]MBQ6001201.1 single-stranded DNA-binding protein [Clostridia bacterium]